MFSKYSLWIVLIIAGALLISPQGANAEIKITDCFSLAGFARYEFGIHTAESNPNLAENHDLSLSRFFLQTEWTYKPTDKFKLYANIRFLGDTTSLWDDDVRNYDAFPVDVPKDKALMMRMANYDHFRAEVWELYGDVKLGDLWLRLGRQQFAWGEMVGVRILDAIYSLDLSWNMVFEPEEFELIRIPAWTIRGIYNLTSLLPGWITNPSIEAFVIPGDIYPTFTANPGAPFNLVTFPPQLEIHNKDHRGDVAYGVRVGAGAGAFYGTLNYIHTYTQEMTGLDLRGPGLNLSTFQVMYNVKYPMKDLFGMTLNYAFPNPYNLVLTFEGVYSPNEPWQDNHIINIADNYPFPLPDIYVPDRIRDQGKWTYAIRADRNTWLWPEKFLSPSMAQCTLQFVQYVVEGDVDKIRGTLGAFKIHKSMEWWVAQVSQPLLHADLTPTVQFVYDTRDAYLLKPSIQYKYGNHWYFDVFATFLGGSEKNPYDQFGSLYWGDTVYGRVTYQF